MRSQRFTLTTTQVMDIRVEVLPSCPTKTRLSRLKTLLAASFKPLTIREN